MTHSLRHRGPDGEGVWIGNGIALGHRRLAIVDLSDAGAQPMESACRRYIIAFNGEIYNHRELRRQLLSASAAPVWRGHSDTESLIAGIAHWGLDETLSRVSGMFALALWDRQEQRLQLARDRIGEKPLYWGWCGRDIVFGSELKAVRRHPSFVNNVCPEALAQLFRFAYIPAPRSIHKGIYKLEPGCILDIKGQPPPLPPDAPLRPGNSIENLSIRRFWSLHDIIDSGYRSKIANEKEIIDELEHSLAGAVASQMIADVPIGAFLSGGIDSSLIVALMQAQSTRPIKTFTVGFETPEYNEAPYAAAVARHLGTEHTAVIATEREAQGIIPQIPDLYDEPFADSSQIPTHIVCNLAKLKVTVALSGDGGDELFAGYNRYFWGPRMWSRVDWMPPAARRALGSIIASVPVRGWDALGWLAGGRLATRRLGDKAHKMADRLQTVDGPDELYRSLVSEWNSTPMVRGIDSEPHSVLDDPVPPSLEHDRVGRMTFQDMRSYLPDDILCKVDRAAMGVSLETRMPFLDVDVIKAAARLPMNMKIRDDRGKWALRQILQQYVPKDLIERPKAGFGIPVGEWLRGSLRSWAEDLLSSQSLSRQDFLEPKPIRRAWEEHLSGSRDWSHRLWIALMFMAWRDHMQRAE